MRGNPRKIVSMTPAGQPFVSFSESALLAILWKNVQLKAEIIRMTGITSFVPAHQDVANWLSGEAPGTLLTRLLTDVG